MKLTEHNTAQYAYKRKDYRRNYNSTNSSLYYDNRYSIQNNSIQKPLQSSGTTQIAFKGLNLSFFEKTFKPVVKPIPKKLTQKVFNSLKDISDTQYEYYSQIRKNYVDFIKLPADAPKTETEKLRRELAQIYRKKNGITNEMAEKISEENLLYLPKKTIATNFISQVAAPFTAIYKGIKKLIIPQNQQQLELEKMQKKILKEFSSLEGLIKSHEIWENLYRKSSGNTKWTHNNDFIIPNDILYGKIQRRRNKVVDPNKGKYSSTSLMLGNRLISGIVYSYFLGTDAYNTTMRYSTDKQEASNQRKSRIAQEFSRIGMNLYVQNLLFGTFESAVNRSLTSAMLVSGSTVAFSEVLGRKLVGKPIMPSNKETLDKLEQEMAEKSGILPAIGRLLTNVKKKEKSTAIKVYNELTTSYVKNKPNDKTFKSFCASDNIENKTNNAIAFKGNIKNLTKLSKNFYTNEHIFNKDTLTNVVNIIEKADKKTADSIKKFVMKSIEKSTYFKKQGLKKPETFEDLITDPKYIAVPVGKDKTPWGLFTTSLFIPVKFVKNLFLKTGQNLQKLYNQVVGKKNNTIAEQLNKLQTSTIPEHQEKLKRFESFYKKRLQLEAWANSTLNQEEKQLKLFKEFNEIIGKEAEEIQGTKNILLWLDKQIKKEKITIQPDGTYSATDINKIQKLLKDSVLAADGSKHVEYDGNTIAQVNINLSRAITTLFLMTDAYNLTMQYSNDNKKDANKSAKNRAAQEVSRIAVSAYMLAFVHNLLSKLCNSSLAGAFTLTAITSTINDSLSREVVGVPLTAKNHDQLIELDKKNAESKNPIKKALAYSIGKKGVAKAMLSSSNEKIKEKNSTDNINIDYFANEFFLAPKIM